MAKASRLCVGGGTPHSPLPSLAPPLGKSWIHPWFPQCSCSLCTSTILYVPPVFLYSLYLYHPLCSPSVPVLSACTLCTPLYSLYLYRPLCPPSVPVLSVLHVLHCTLCSLPFSTVLCVPPVFLYSLYSMYYCTLCSLPFFTILCVPSVFLYSLYSMYYTVLSVLYRSLLFSVFPQCSCTLCTPCSTLYSLFSTILYSPLCSPSVPVLSVPLPSSMFPQCSCTLCTSTVLCVPPVFLYSLYSMYYTVLSVLYRLLCSPMQCSCTLCTPCTNTPL